MPLVWRRAPPLCVVRAAHASRLSRTIAALDTAETTARQAADGDTRSVAACAQAARNRRTKAVSTASDMLVAVLASAQRWFGAIGNNADHRRPRSKPAFQNLW